MIKISDVLREKIEILNQNGIENSREKAIIILQYELNVSKETILIHGEREIGLDLMQKIDSDIQQILNGIPVQYITGIQDFFGLEFCVSKDVLIPQPDTEIVVQEVLDFGKSCKKNPRILDICTGSGAIAVSLAKNMDAEIVASDISKSALDIAEKNAKKNGANIRFIHSICLRKLMENLI